MVGVAPHFEVLSLRIMLFLVPTSFLVFSMCALYDNVLSSVTPRYTGSRGNPGRRCIPYSRVGIKTVVGPCKSNGHDRARVK